MTAKKPGQVRRVSYLLMIVIAVIAAAASAVISNLMIKHGLAPLELSPVKAIVMLAIAVGIVIWGLGVKRMREGKETSMTPLRAVRVAAFSQSCALFGAAVFGWRLVQLGVAVSLWDSPVGHPGTASAIIGALAAVILTGAGKTVEGWCVIDDSDDKDNDQHKQNRIATV